MLWPLLGGAVLGNLPRIGLPAVSAEVEHMYLWGYFLFATIAYFRWTFLVTSSICDYLGINCLTIPYEKRMANKRAAAEAKAGSANGQANGKKSQ